MVKKEAGFYHCGMYVSDLNLITKARLLDTQDVARSLPPVKPRPSLLRRVAAHLRRR